MVVKVVNGEIGDLGSESCKNIGWQMICRENV